MNNVIIFPIKKKKKTNENIRLLIEKTLLQMQYGGSFSKKNGSGLEKAELQVKRILTKYFKKKDIPEIYNLFFACACVQMWGSLMFALKGTNEAGTNTLLNEEIYQNNKLTAFKDSDVFEAKLTFLADKVYEDGFISNETMQDWLKLKIIYNNLISTIEKSN